MYNRVSYVISGRRSEYASPKELVTCYLNEECDSALLLALACGGSNKILANSSSERLHAISIQHIADLAFGPDKPLYNKQARTRLYRI